MSAALFLRRMPVRVTHTVVPSAAHPFSSQQLMQRMCHHFNLFLLGLRMTLQWCFTYKLLCAWTCTSFWVNIKKKNFCILRVFTYLTSRGPVKCFKYFFILHSYHSEFSGSPCISLISFPHWCLYFVSVLCVGTCMFRCVRRVRRQLTSRGWLSLTLWVHQSLWQVLLLTEAFFQPLLLSFNLNFPNHFEYFQCAALHCDYL